MQRIFTFTLAILLIFNIPASARNTIKGGDSKIIYIGRTLCENGEVSFDWSGVTCIVEFEGTALTLDYSDTKCNWLNVWTDRTPDENSDAIIKLGGNRVTLASRLPEGKHRVVIQKRTEGEQGTLTFKSFSTDGRFLKAKRASDRLIEFIGDSYTCGYGTESRSGKEHFKPATENCNLTYAAILGRMFNSDIRMVSHSGRGVVRNYGGYDLDKPMCSKYIQTFDCDTTRIWTPSEKEVKPQIVVIYLGTNDFSCGEHPTPDAWCEGYRAIIAQVRDFYGNVPVLCVASKADELLADYVRDAVKKCGFGNVHHTAINPAAHDDSSDLGADSHPNYKGHRKVALCIMPYISTLTGWDLPEFIH